MLARPERHRCIECGLPFGADGFQLHYGRLEEGPAILVRPRRLVLTRMLDGASQEARGGGIAA